MKVTNLLFLIPFLCFSCSEKDLPEINISTEVLSEIDSRLFGQFLEKCSWGGEVGGDLVINPATGEIDPVVLRHLRSMNIPVIRYPGGTDVDYYAWTDMIDFAPGQQKRKPYRAYREGDGEKVVSDNRLGINEFFELCEELGSEPIYVLNIGDAFYHKVSLQEAKENAAALLAYCNMEQVASGPDWPEYRRKNGRELPFNLKNIQIGNESWGFKGFDWQVDAHDPELVDHLVNCILAVADTLKAMDPGLRIIADGVFSQANEILEIKGKGLIDYLVFHIYQPWGINTVLKEDSILVPWDQVTTEDTWKAWVATPYMDSETGMSVLADYAPFNNALGSSFDVAVTEWNWNGWYGGEYQENDLPQPDLAKGLGAAGIIHAMMRQGDKIKMACQSMLAGKSWGITGIRVDPDYRQDAVPLPTGQVTGLYSAYHGSELMDVRLENMPFYSQPLRMNDIQDYTKVAFLDVLATRSADRIYLHVINRSFDEDHEVRLNFEQSGVKRSYIHHLLSGDKEAEVKNKKLIQNADIQELSLQKQGKDFTLRVPAASVSVFEFFY